MHSADVIRDVFTCDSVNRITLSNGLTVIHKPDHSAALVSAQVWVKTGSIHEDEWLGAGLSHSLEHMLFKGTSGRSSMDINREVHAAGAYINAYTTYDRTVYYIDVPSESAKTAFDILGDITFSATLSDDDFAIDRDVILREIAMGEDDPDQKLFRRFVQTVYQSHPFRHPVIGWKELFEQIDAAALRAYYRRRYVPNNVVFVVVGALTEAEVLDLAEAYLGQVPRAVCSPVFIPDEPIQLAPRSDRLVGDYQLERGMLGFRVPGLGHSDLPSLEILAHALGHGQSSILWQRLREEKRLVHNVDASCWTPGNESMFWIGYGCDACKREAVEAEIAAIIQEVATAPFPETVVHKAIKQSIVSEINARKTMSGQAARLGATEVVLGDLGYAATRLQLLEKVQPEMLNQVAANYLRPERLTTTSLVPRSENKKVTIEHRSVQPMVLFSEQVLSNGARLLFQPGGELPKVHFRLACLGGASYEPKDKRGITGVLASLLIRDTKKRTAKALVDLIEAAGGSFSESIGNNTFGFSLEVLPSDVPLALDLIDQALNHLRMDQRAFEVEREGQIASIREDEDDILECGRKYLRKRFFGKHPYSVDYLGRIADLEKLTIEDVETARRTQLNAASTVLAVSGCFDRSVLEPKLSSILASLKSNSVLEPIPEITLPTAYSGKVIMEREQAVVLYGYPDVGVCNEDFILSEVLNELFSGMASGLFNRIREELGLAYYVASDRIPGLNGGMFSFYAGTQSEKTEEVSHEILLELERVCSGHFETGEIESCLKRLSVQTRQSLQVPGSRAMQAALNALYGLPINAWNDYDHRLSQVTPERLVKHAQQLFKPEHAVALVVAPN